MDIIDSHAHLSTFTHPGKSFGEIRDALLASMRETGISHSCVIPDNASGSAVADLATTLELTGNQPSLFALGTSPIPVPDAATLEHLDALAGSGAIRGIKLYPGFEPFYPSAPECRPIYDICLRHDMPVMFHSGETLNEAWREEYNYPWEFAKLAEQLPELTIIIAHFSQPHLEACQNILLRFPSLHADISSLAFPTVVGVCGREAIRAVLAETIRKQPEKVLFGTDWPISETEPHIKLVESLDISPEARDMVFAGNARRLFKLPTD